MYETKYNDFIMAYEINKKFLYCDKHVLNICLLKI